jgi:hypothetical protein
LQNALHEAELDRIERGQRRAKRQREREIDEREIEKKPGAADPPANPRATVDLGGVLLTPDTDVRALVLAQLEGHGPGRGSPTDYDPVDWLTRIEPKLHGTPFHGSLGGAVAEGLTHRDAIVRARAIHFFRHVHVTMPGAERVANAWRERRPLFANIEDPLHPGETLEQALLCVVGARLPRELETAREAALEPGLGGSVVGGLIGSDTEWVLDHAVKIVERSPDAGLIILIGLQQMRRELLPLGVILAPLAARDRNFFDYLERWVNDAEVRHAIAQAARIGGAAADLRKSRGAKRRSRPRGAAG